MADEQATAAGGTGDTMVTTLNRPWLVKMVIFIIVLALFGLWGLYDATIAYPARGNAHAEYAQWQYLEAAKKDGKLNAVAEGVKDPSARLDELSHKTRNDLEQTEHDWLVALSRMGRLKEAANRIDGPNQKLDELAKKWSGISAKPVPLEYYDLPFQWSIAVVCFGLGAYVTANVLRSAARKYRWNPDTQTLTLHDGREVRASDLADVDKRKWHKYFCSLVLTDGAVYELDVLKYTGLEEWVLQLERTQFPDRAEAEDNEDVSGESGGGRASGDDAGPGDGTSEAEGTGPTPAQ